MIQALIEFDKNPYSAYPVPGRIFRSFDSLFVTDTRTIAFLGEFLGPFLPIPIEFFSGVAHVQCAAVDDVGGYAPDRTSRGMLRKICQRGQSCFYCGTSAAVTGQ